MKAIIVAGGKGERLHPLTYNIPKPMVEVGGKPILLHIIELLKKHGIVEIILALCYLPDAIITFFGDGRKFGVEIKYTFEDIKFPLGTAGSISMAREMIKDTFIVTYADILRDLDIKEMVDFHKNNNSFATINLYKRASENAKSKVIIDKKNKIIEFMERPDENNPQEKIWVNGSFYVFEPQIFKFIPDNQKIDFGMDIFPKLIEAGKPVFGFPSNGFLIDIGNIEKLELVRKTFK